MAERTIRGGVDAYVSQVTPALNNNGVNVALVKNGTGVNAHLYSYLKAPAPVEAGVSVISATLRFYVRGASHANVNLRARAADASWKAAKITWRNQPGTMPGTAGLIGFPVDAVAHADGFVEFDVTAHMQAVADGAKWFGWRIACQDTNRWVTLSTAEAKLQVRRPELTVEYSNAPAAPVDLSPGGGRFISTGSPILRYTYLDFGGNRELTFQQIQVQNLASSVNYDTGKIAASEPEYDLDDGSFVALTSGQDARWRVRTWDGAGLVGPWSDWAYFERLNKGTLTINNPSAAPDNFVQEVTPPITWTHGGMWSQVAYQVIVQQKFLDKWTKIYDSRKRSGNDDSLTLPKGVLTKANWTSIPGTDWSVPTEYRVVVRTWDGQGRQSTPGDPAFYQAIRPFTVKEGATAKVTDLVVSQFGAWPFAEIVWKRSTAPDKFIIARNGNIVDTVTPDQVDRGDGTYRYLDMEATLNRPHTWAVLPVVNGVMSSVESTHVTTTVKADGIWLLDPDRPFNTAVLIVGFGGEGDLSMAAEDQAEEYNVIGRSAPVQVINAVGLAAGSVSGHVTFHPHIPNVSKLDWRNRLRDLKAEPGKRLRLIAGDYNMPVVVRDVSDGPNPAHDLIDVSFNFVQDNTPAWLR